MARILGGGGYISRGGSNTGFDYGVLGRSGLSVKIRWGSKNQMGKDFGPGRTSDFAPIPGTGSGGDKRYPKPAALMGLRAWKNQSKSVVDVYIKNMARMMESFAKKHHKWTNRTGNAERYLHTHVSKSALGWSQTVELSHGDGTHKPYIFYGRYLEYSMNKRFAIIAPTMRHFEKRMIGDLNGLLTKRGIPTISEFDFD